MVNALANDHVTGRKLDRDSHLVLLTARWELARHCGDALSVEYSVLVTEILHYDRTLGYSLS